ncbi:TonB-dependent receptor [Marivirga lumbricoides]|uniref:TonB-dependent receptor n=2 Tax=Marivirga lumbricoides TaxID=1046115 RepID=A0ABQ1LNW4_9BACT|nr:TonB-dependent receptor [Marivirga lumbricoides]
MFYIPLGVFSQDNAALSGTVMSNTGEQLIGAVVLLKETNQGTTTDLEGKFELLNIESGTYTLQISFLGFEPQEQTISLQASQKKVLQIKLSESKLVLDVVEVKGKSMATEVNEQSYAVTAIAAKEFNNSTTDVKEVLNRVSGVRVLEEGGLGSNLSFSLNGFSGDQVKFFMDGIPMDNFGSSLSLSTIPINSIQRIEVYKGVVPVWLGTDALGGAVNIVTHQKSDFLDASYSFGSFNTHRASLNGAQTNDKTGFTVRGSINYNYSDNNYKVHVPLTDALGNNSENKMVNAERFHDAYRSGMARLETGFVNRKYADQLLLGIIASVDENELQNGATMSRPFGNMTNTSRTFVPTLKYRKENFLTEGLDISFNSSFNITETKNIDTLTSFTFNWLGEKIPSQDSKIAESGKPNNIDMDDTEFTSQMNLSYQLNSRHSLSLNYSYQYFSRETYDSEDPDNISNQMDNTLEKTVLGLAYKYDHDKNWSTTLFGKGYFLQLNTSKEFDFGEDTRRIDAYENKSEEFGYGIATSYVIIPSIQIKASYEHTYRLPWANEVFGNGQFILPNPDLGPEQSANLNIGGSYMVKLNGQHRLAIESSFIYRESKDLIYQVITVANPETRYNNLADVRTLGVEGSVDYEWNNLINAGASLTYQNITDQADQVYSDYAGYQTNFNKGFRVPNKPYLFGNGRVGFHKENLIFANSSFRVNYFYNFNKEYFLSWARFGTKDSKLIIPGQSSHNVELSYSLTNGKYNIAVECRNLTDERLYDKFYLQKPGRAFYLKLRYSIGK